LGLSVTEGQYVVMIPGLLAVIEKAQPKRV
jgi:hypothetical protein